MADEFDPDTFLAEDESEEFDPDAFLAEDVEETPKPETGAEFLERMGGTVSAGLSDIPFVSELGRRGSAAIKAGGEALFGDSEKELGELYDEKLAAEQERAGILQERHPTATTVGGVAGAMVLPGGLPAQLVYGMADTGMKTDWNPKAMATTGAIEGVMGKAGDLVGAGVKKLIDPAVLARKGKEAGARVIDPYEIHDAVPDSAMEKIADEMIEEGTITGLKGRKALFKDLAQKDLEVGSMVHGLREGGENAVTRKRLEEAFLESAEKHGHNPTIAKKLKAAARDTVSAEQLAKTKAISKTQAEVAKIDANMANLGKKVEFIPEEKAILAQERMIVDRMLTKSKPGTLNHDRLLKRSDALDLRQEKLLTKEVRLNDAFDAAEMKRLELQDRLDLDLIDLEKLNNQGFSLHELAERKATHYNKAHDAKGSVISEGDLAVGDVLKNQEDLVAPHIKEFRDKQAAIKTAKDSLRPAARSNSEKLAQALAQYGVPGMIGGGIGGAVAGPVGAAAGVAIASTGRHLMKKYGNQLAAIGFKKGSKIFQNQKWAQAFKRALDEGGSKSAAMTHMMLMKRDSKYREAFNKEQAEKQEEE